MNYSDPFRALGLIALLVSTIVTALNVESTPPTQPAEAALIIQITATPPTPVTPTPLPNTPTISVPTSIPTNTPIPSPLPTDRPTERPTKIAIIPVFPPTSTPKPTKEPTPTRKWANSPLPSNIFPLAVNDVRLVQRKNTEVQTLPADTDWHIGIISGHRGYDSGAVCEDDGSNVQEAEVVYAIAQETQKKLEAEGVTVDVLNEFDNRLQGYEAHAVISLHADMCHPDPILTGFKSAAAPDPQSKILQICVNERYEQVTGLAPDGSIYHITGAMTHYHAFRKVALETPIIILETGYLHHDRDLLLNSELPAAGITASILCYLKLTATE